MTCALIGIGAVATIASLPDRPRAPLVGMVRATQIRLATEIGGSLAKIHVKNGAEVRRGEILAELSATELSAAVAQGHAAVDLAKAARDRVYAGVRSEELAALKAEVEKSKARLTFLKEQLARVTVLARDSFDSRQALDQAEGAVAVAVAEVAEAAASYSAAMNGPTRTERAVADARVEVAVASLATLQRRFDKTVLRAPTDGTVTLVVAEVGENLRPGQPVLAISAAGGTWLSFNVREDRLADLGVGHVTKVTPANAKPALEALVTEMRPLGSFATWQAERAVGDHDLNTIRIRLDPQGNDADLLPGMTVWLLAP